LIPEYLSRSAWFPDVSAKFVTIRETMEQQDPIQKKTEDAADIALFFFL